MSREDIIRKGTEKREKRNRKNETETERIEREKKRGRKSKGREGDQLAAATQLDWNEVVVVVVEHTSNFK